MPTFPALDGTILHYDVIDNDAEGNCPVIVIAGGGSRHPSYLGDLAGLSSRHPLVIPHLRGVGKSPAASNVEDGSFWRQAQDIESLRVFLGIERTLIAGHSAGTRLAMAYAVQFSHRLAGLLLIGPPAAHLVDEPSDVDVLVDKHRGEPTFDAALAAQKSGPDLSDDAAFNAWQQVVAPSGYASWGAKEKAHASAGYWNLAASRAYFSMDPPNDFASRLGEVTAPVLVVAGADDCFTGVAPVKALAELFPRGRIVMVDHCGHYPWVEQPIAFRQAVDPFIDAYC
jgi:pimeloyl-ACP methyl ester carboxylesterase